MFKSLLSVSLLSVFVLVVIDRKIIIMFAFLFSMSMFLNSQNIT